MQAKLIVALCCVVTLFLLCECNSNKKLGDACVFENSPGVCKLRADCPGGSFNSKAKCKKDKTWVVCCTGNEKPILPSVCPNHTKEELKIEKDGRGKARDKCIEWLDLIKPCIDTSPLPSMPNYNRIDKCYHTGAPLIINGENASLGEFPHQAVLGIKTDALRKIEWKCGGTLISDQWILTAAHCVFVIGYGIINKVMINTLSIDDPGEVHDIAEIIKHPEYLRGSKYHDIALLKLKKEVQLSSTIVPACLDYEGLLNVKEAIVTGHGKTENNEMAMVLQKATIQAFSHEECENVHNIKKKKELPRGIDNTSQICFGSKVDEVRIMDSCWGDSGGPLQVKSTNVYCTYVVLGVVSFSDGCGKKGIPGVYTRVSNYIDWIEKIVWP